MGHKWHAWQDRDQGQRFAEVLIQRRVCLLHDCCDVQCFCIYLKRVIVLKFVPEDWEFGLRFTSMRASHNWGKSLTVIGIGSPHHDHHDPMGPQGFHNVLCASKMSADLNICPGSQTRKGQAEFINKYTCPKWLANLLTYCLDVVTVQSSQLCYQQYVVKF